MLFSPEQLAKYNLASSLKKSRTTELGELLTEFRDTINIARLNSPIKPTTIARIGILVAPLIKDKNYSKVYSLMSVCRDYGTRYKTYKGEKNYAEGFSKKFYFELKTK